jgi:hypothetical protein
LGISNDHDRISAGFPVSTSAALPTNQIASFETQMIPMTPQVLRRTLRLATNGRNRINRLDNRAHLQADAGYLGGLADWQRSRPLNDAGGNTIHRRLTRIAGRMNEGRKGGGVAS